MRGVLIINTGSPASKDKKDVQWFIGAMLSDPLVMSVPSCIRNILAKDIIAPLRASRSAAAYAQIWDYEHNSSPLIYNTHRLAECVEAESGLPVEVAMRYGKPFIQDAFDRLLEKAPDMHELVVVPMFPQYAQSSYQTAVDEVRQCFDTKTRSFALKFIEPFYDDPAYIDALADSLKPYIKENYDRLFFSFHSLPLSHEEAARSKGKDFDYVFQIKETIRLVTKELNLDPNKNRLVFSSAIGRNWLKPSLNETMKELPKVGAKNILVITPGFPADNLETLYDITKKAQKLFLRHGGEKLHFVPGLNSESYWVEAVIRMVANTL